MKSQPHAPYAIHWFRRDLRLEANEALSHSVDAFGGRVLGVFCFDRKFLARPDFSHHRFAFFLKTLLNLREEMRARGGDLLFLDEGPEVAFRKLLNELKSSPLKLPDLITFQRDYEPFARSRDAKLSDLFFSEFSLNVKTFRDHLLIEPSELQKDGGGVYQVYTPFKNRWVKLFSSEEINLRLRRVNEGLKRGSPSMALQWPKDLISRLNADSCLENMIESTEQALPEHLRAQLPEVGFLAAKKILKQFQENGIDQYEAARDIPHLSGTSKMSIYLKNGSITVPQIICFLKLTEKSPPSHVKYFQELIWREFYYHILFHFPNAESESFNPKYRDLPWENRKDFFQAWCEGKTGFPIVDAGMRQLNETGWMHNRVRMIVASFLTKDLLVDWRWGEKFFMEKLLDGDLAPNNGGWQWAASTGCDAQPYFRIFNPISQGEKFDPDGKYIRHWVPELRGLSDKQLHQPQPNAIIDHATQREKALELFKRARAH
jgi:deoxyribodipyrimidine photo-lyase